MTDTVQNSEQRAARFFNRVVDHPKKILLLGLVLLIAWASQLSLLTNDTRADAFLAEDNPALVYKNKVKQQFGLADPLVIAVVNPSVQGVFNPTTLALVDYLSQGLLDIPNINPDRVVSLATENNITGTYEGMEVEPFFDPYPETQADAERIRQAVADFPLYQGSLVANNGQATLIIAEMLDPQLADETFQQLMALVNNASISQDEQLHVAGEGAVSGYLGSYINADAQRLNPLAGGIITLIMVLAFRRFLPALLGNIIIAASVLITLGVMATSGTPFFVISNAMPVILIGISVADAIHIFSEYYDLQARHPERSIKVLVVDAMVEMWRPITLTTLTTVAGFLGLYLAAYMPPFRAFGLFTALGVFVAWFYSLLVLPAAMVLCKPKASKALIRAAQTQRPDLFSRLMTRLGGYSLKHAGKTVAFAATIAAISLVAASNLRVDEKRIETFHPSEPIFQADRAINHYLDGSNNLDIVIEAAEIEGLFEPTYLLQMEALQQFAETLPHVNGSTSIVDYLKQMSRSLNENRAEAYRVPGSRDLVAQYFLLYSTSAEPTDFEEVVDYDYRTANIRLNMDTGAYADIRPVVEALEDYIETHFTDAALTANLSGRVNVNYHWIKDLGASHFTGLAVTLLLVFLISAWLFRSLTAGLLALLPVASSILLVYASMALLDIPLGIGTSMFASVAVGLGVDFAIHTIDRLRVACRRSPDDLDAALMMLYPNTGRALLFNFLAISCGFGVLMSSQVVPLTNFGTIVVLSVSTSFISSMTLIPALVKLFKPAFICRPCQPSVTMADAVTS
ncbi:MAG: MMPL family transporter [Halopseudomonas sp.]